MWQNWANITLAVWLVTAAFIPAITTSHAATMWNNSLAGGVAVLIAVLAAVGNRQIMCWVNVVIGAWLVTSAFIPAMVGKSGFWNDLSIGVLIGGISTWAIVRTESGAMSRG